MSSTASTARSSPTGGALPENPNPSWQGYSTATWAGDTLVIETIGFRDDVWIDWAGSMVTERGSSP